MNFNQSVEVAAARSVAAAPLEDLVMKTDVAADNTPYLSRGVKKFDDIYEMVYGHEGLDKAIESDPGLRQDYEVPLWDPEHNIVGTWHDRYPSLVRLDPWGTDDLREADLHDDVVPAPRGKNATEREKDNWHRSATALSDILRHNGSHHGGHNFPTDTAG